MPSGCAEAVNLTQGFARQCVSVSDHFPIRKGFALKVAENPIHLKLCLETCSVQFCSCYWAQLQGLCHGSKQWFCRTRCQTEICFPLGGDPCLRAIPNVSGLTALVALACFQRKAMLQQQVFLTVCCRDPAQ